MRRLIGESVALTVSDPWEFGTECGVRSFYGKVTDFGIEKIGDVDIERTLVTLDAPINYSSANYVRRYAMCVMKALRLRIWKQD